MFHNIPAELRAMAQWVTWRLEDQGGVKPTKVPYNPTTGQKAASNNPFTWTTFENAVGAASTGMYTGIGFVLSKADPYTIIDLDEVHDDAESSARQKRIFDAFDSYSEVSPSGKGLHIIIKGEVPSGRKRSYVEIYSDVRFMTMTGNVYRNAPIAEYNILANSLWQEMGGQAVLNYYEGDTAEKMSDQAVLNMAATAENKDKFIKLWQGQWEEFYSSQSEADFALINIIAFYTKHKGQIVRLFRTSALGQRPKAQRNAYVDYMVNRSFDRMLPLVDIDALKIQIETAMAARQASAPANPFTNAVMPQNLHVMASTEPQYAATVPAHFTPYEAPPAPMPNPLEEVTPTAAPFVYVKPPGLVGEIANFLYEAAPRQVPEIALVGALALMSGICGRAYNVSGVGLNQYIFLLAATGSGKDGIATGIDKLMSALKLTVPSASSFIGPSEIASPEALLKYLDSTSNCFVSLISEFALKLKQLTSIGANPAQAGLKRLILSLFSFSGAGKLLQPMIYSDRQKNTAVIEAPAFSIMGESTPEGFYEALNEAMIADGLLPRFTIIEYLGDRPPLNESHHLAKPDARLIEHISGLCGQALTLNQANRVIDVKLDETATRLFREFEGYTTQMINNGKKDAIKQLWNRAHLKALKLAALVSVGVNPFDPTIDEWATNWAIGLVVNDVTKLLDRFNTGRIGQLENEDSKQVHDLSKAVKRYITHSYDEIKSYKIDPFLHAAKVVPYSYLSRCCLNQSSFRMDRQGATAALKKCLQLLTDRGDIQEMSPKERSDNFKTTARLFVIRNPSAFLDESLKV